MVFLLRLTATITTHLNAAARGSPILVIMIAVLRVFVAEGVQNDEILNIAAFKVRND